MVLQVLGDGFDRPGRCLDLLEGFKQPLPPKRPHWRGARCQVTSTIELARAHGEQAAKVRESHASRWTSLKLLARFLKLLRHQETSPTTLMKLGHTCPTTISTGSVDHLMDSILKLSQRTATTTEPGPTAIQDNWLPGMPVQTALSLHWAGNHA